MQISYLNIVIPTYTPHFPRVAKFLKSFDKHCLDKKHVCINFIISGYETQEFIKYIKPYDNILNIKIHSLNKLIKEVFNLDISEVQLLNKIGKYNFQCLKKLLGTYLFGNPYSLLMDSETLVIRDFKLWDLMDKYFTEEKTIFYTDNSNTFPDMQKQVTDNCLDLIGKEKGLPFYMLEAYNWFFDNRILNDLFTYIEGIHNSKLFKLLATKYKIIFETPLYYLFIYYNNDKYKYNFICINNELIDIMGNEEFTKFRQDKHMPTPFEFHAKVMNSQKMVSA